MTKFTLKIRRSKRLTTRTNNKIEQLYQHTTIKVLWMWSLKISYCTILTLLAIMWDDKPPLWWDAVKLVSRHCDIALGYYCPSDATAGQSSAPGDPGSSGHDYAIAIGCQNQTMKIPGCTKQDHRRFHHTTQYSIQLKTLHCLFLKFSI